MRLYMSQGFVPGLAREKKRCQFRTAFDFRCGSFYISGTFPLHFSGPSSGEDGGKC